MINTVRMPRPLVGVGHSFGGNALTNVALLNPRLLTSLVLLDPVISHFASIPGSKAADSANPARMSMYRRDVWPSREAAAASFRKSAFYKGWDERVLDRWIEFGLKDTASGEVALATEKAQEVFTYLRPSWPAYDAQGKTLTHPEHAPDLDPSLNEKWPTYPFYRAEGPSTLERLPNVRPGVLYIFGALSNLSPANLQQEKVETTGVGTGGSGGAKAGRVRAVNSPEHGHLIPMEAPGVCAENAAGWIKEEVGRWWADERKYDEWTRKTGADKVAISDEFKSYMGKPSKPSARADTKL